VARHVVLTAVGSGECEAKAEERQRSRTNLLLSTIEAIEEQLAANQSTPKKKDRSLASAAEPGDDAK
jgi:hypothetical protein